jgi:TPR repeat protein
MWLERAAKQGYAPAQNSLGLMYLNGEGVAANPQLAYVWLERAVRQGQPGSELNRDFAAALLDAGSKAEARAQLEAPGLGGG